MRRLPLMLLMLIAAVALGWLIRDVVFPSPAGGDARPTVAAAQPTAAPAVDPTATPTTSPANTPTQFVPTNTALPATSEPATPVQTSPTPPSAPAVVGYAGYTVREGDTLATIAEVMGSTQGLIASYNLLDGEPQAGRALIIPLLEGAGEAASEPLLVRRGRSDKKVVALTLDAGGTAESAELVLRALRERNLKITFFLTGKWMRENPDLTLQIVADGHEIANHTITHRDLTRLGDDEIREELAGTETILHEIAGEQTTIRPFFRPPYGAYNERVLRLVESEGYLPIYWTLDSLDSVGEPKTAEFLVQRVTGKLPPEQLQGAIILAHCGFSWTAEALPTILDRFAEMGFEVKKLSEVL